MVKRTYAVMCGLVAGAAKVVLCKSMKEARAECRRHLGVSRLQRAETFSVRDDVCEHMSERDWEEEIAWVLNDGYGDWAAIFSQEV